MKSRSSDESRAASLRARRRAHAALIACLITPGVLTWLWSAPRAAPPLEMPPLVLDPSAVREQLDADRRAAAQAVEDVERLRLYRESNVAEHEGGEPPDRARARREALVERARTIATERGDAALAALRASDVERAEAALTGELPRRERAREVGDFVRMMERYGMAREGRQLAPRFVVRTALKARWNAMHGLPLTADFSPVEEQAYWGWLAIEGTSAALDTRLGATDHYERAGGAQAAEIRAMLLYDKGELEAAARAFEAAYELAPSFRLRNHRLACNEPQ